MPKLNANKFIQSRYNHEIPLPDGEFVLYNALSGAVAKLDSKLDWSALQNEEESALEENGFLVESDEQESKYVAQRRMPSKNIQSYTIVLTEACNLRCTYCHQRQGKDNSSFSSLEKVKIEDKHIVDFILSRITPEVSVINFIWTGGEPLLELPRLKLLIERVSFAVPKGIQINSHLLSNGVKLPHLSDLDIKTLFNSM
ncbi:MAG: 4Fe-4S cluster-binding domain-containing protein, partial [Oligoflexia bacterium]|nr:4Fe-4S cluster-binding domain-containing protein [Oligoflexia bacterium]